METDFWQEKTPCWVMHECPSYLRSECPAFQHPEYPCWEVEGTYCKYNERTGRMDDTRHCYRCNVFMIYGHGVTIEMKLRRENLLHAKSLHSLVERRAGSGGK